jgi:hypothetical protein
MIVARDETEERHTMSVASGDRAVTHHSVARGDRGETHHERGWRRYRGETHHEHSKRRSRRDSS